MNIHRFFLLWWIYINFFCWRICLVERIRGCQRLNWIQSEFSTTCAQSKSRSCIFLSVCVCACACMRVLWTPRKDLRCLSIGIGVNHIHAHTSMTYAPSKSFFFAKMCACVHVCAYVPIVYILTCKICTWMNTHTRRNEHITIYFQFSPHILACIYVQW